MDSASTQNMDSHMAASILSSTATILPSGGVSAAAAIFSSGNESLSFDIHSFAVAINNTWLLPSHTSTLLQWFLPLISQQQPNPITRLFLYQTLNK